MKKLSTKNEITWCPGCTNFSILASLKRSIENLMNKGVRQEQFAIVGDIGCHGKMFDYLNLSGIYGLHGRAIPTAMGIKLGNSNLKVLAFGGDGAIYSEGMGHFIHACRFNPDITLIVHDNRDYSLTGGQPTPTTQKGYKSKSKPFGEMNEPLNPLKIALASGAGFIARCNARDITHTSEIIEKAVNYRGFSFVEIIQDCLIFNTAFNNLDKNMYKVNNKNLNKAKVLVEEWNYSSRKGKIPIGIIYSKEKEILVQKI